MKIKNYKEWDYTLPLIGFIVLVTLLASCAPKYGCPAQRSLITGTVHKPTKRDIRRGMKYSSWEYAHPAAQIMIPGSKSRYIFDSVTVSR